MRKDPATVRRDACVNVRIALTARNAPRNDAVQFGTVDQWTARITEARALADRAAAAHGRIVDPCIVRCSEPCAAFQLRDHVYRNVLQVVRELGVGELQSTNTKVKICG